MILVESSVMSTSQSRIIVVLFLLLEGYSTPAGADIATNVDFSIGGRVKIDAIYNTDTVGRGVTSKSDLAFSPASIPVTGSKDADPEINLRESRLWAILRLPLPARELAGYVEFDLFDTEKNRFGQTRVANDPRLRHAYGTFGGFTFGRTYTTFFNIASYPEINDANGPLGVLNIRQELLRYERKITWGTVFIALEKPESTLTSFNGGRIQTNADHTPDIIGKLEFSGARGNWSLSGILREIRAKNKIVKGVEEHEWGGAINAAGRIFLFRRDNLRFSFSWGNTLGRYLSFNAFDDAAIDNTGRISLTTIAGGYVAYQHWWTATWRSSLIIGMAHADQNTRIVPETDSKFFASSHANLLWSPVQDLTVGIEWLHGYRRLENGQSGNLDRLQFSAVYKF